MPDHGVADHNAALIGGQGDKLELEGAAVEKKGMIPGAVYRDELVHNAAIHTDELVLSRLTQTSQLFPLEVAVGQAEEGESGGDLQCG